MVEQQSLEQRHDQGLAQRGFRTEQVDVKSRKVVFRRIEDKRAEPPSHPQPRKGERHPLFGALKGLVRIPPGVDLTEPADSEWGKVYD